MSASSMLKPCPQVGSEESGSQSYVPPDEEDERAQGGAGSPARHDCRRGIPAKSEGRCSLTARVITLTASTADEFTSIRIQTKVAGELLPAAPFENGATQIAVRRHFTELCLQAKIDHAIREDSSQIAALSDRLAKHAATCKCAKIPVNNSGGNNGDCNHTSKKGPNGSIRFPRQASHRSKRLVRCHVVARRDQSRRCNSLAAIGGIADIGMRWSRKARLRMSHIGSVCRFSGETRPTKLRQASLAASALA